ncbi:MAG: hypothetical protein ITF98_04380 [Fermentimonas sp.]|nr:hypothetical protein [Fermentimonas sp.]
MRLFRLLLRKKQSKGHGIHSPFAFDIITNILNSPYSYYAFTDIPDSLHYSPDCPPYSSNGLPNSKEESKKIKKLNHISFRLVNHFKATNILEINPGKGINTLYIKAPSSKINYNSISGIDSFVNSLIIEAEGVNAGRVDTAKLNATDINVAKDSVEELFATKIKYDAIFININEDENSIPSIEWLLDISHENTFWVINPININQSKHFCQLIVNHERVTVTFDTNNTLIVFFRQSYHKHHYFV